MSTNLCERLGIEFPLFAFSHCRDVVAAVSKAGGMGVLGAVGISAEKLEEELSWIDDQVRGKSYGVDLIVPNKFEGKDKETSPRDWLRMVPDSHKDFATDVLREHGLEPGDLESEREASLQFGYSLTEEGARKALGVAFSHPVKLIANALGVPPKIMLDMGREHGVAVAALVGAKEHAVAQVNAGVDIIIASGGEAGGHCGDVSTMVLVPEVCAAIAEIADVPVLAAGGIVTGRQMAAAMTMGAAGAWCGSVWLTTAEAETTPAVKEKMIAATSRDTIRSRSRTGKPSRQLRSTWTDAWEADGAPAPLPMPLQTLVSEPALTRINKLAEGGDAAARNLATYWVGQGVGLMNETLSAGAVVQEFKEDFARAFKRLEKSIGEM